MGKTREHFFFSLLAACATSRTKGIGACAISQIHASRLGDPANMYPGPATAEAVSPFAVGRHDTQTIVLILALRRSTAWTGDGLGSKFVVLMALILLHPHHVHMLRELRSYPDSGKRQGIGKDGICQTREKGVLLFTDANDLEQSWDWPHALVLGGNSALPPRSWVILRRLGRTWNLRKW